MASMNAAQTRYCLTHFPNNISILLAANQGLGKSETVAQCAAEIKGQYIDMRLSQCDTGDMKGMPFHVNGRTIFAPPDWFPMDKGDAKELQALLGLTDAIAAGKYGPVGILHLDELNRATREVQQAGFELVLDRRLNMRRIPDGWRVVASINDDEDIYTVNQMDPALISRFFLINFNPSIDEWLNWASKDNRVHDSIVTFIRKYPDRLDPTPQLLKESVISGVKKVHDRRAWTRFSQTLVELMSQHEKGSIPVHPLNKTPENMALLLLMASGFLGDLAAIDFIRFIESDYEALNADTILNKWSSDTEDRIKKIVDNGSIPELGSYNEVLMAYISDKIKGKLSKNQSKNLYNYLSLLPKEVVADFWMSVSKGKTSEVIDKWYQSDAKYTAVIRDAILNKTKV